MVSSNVMEEEGETAGAVAVMVLGSGVKVLDLGQGVPGREVLCLGVQTKGSPRTTPSNRIAMAWIEVSG